MYSDDNAAKRTSTAAGKASDVKSCRFNRFLLPFLLRFDVGDRPRLPEVAPVADAWSRVAPKSRASIPMPSSRSSACGVKGAGLVPPDRN